MRWSHLKTLATGARRGSLVVRAAGDFEENMAGCVHIFDPVAGGEALVVLDGHTAR